MIQTYEPECSDELDLTPGEMIVVTERDPSGWWMGYNQATKQKGLFPSNYITVIDQVTGLNEGKNRHYGRPVWSEEFGHGCPGLYNPDTKYFFFVKKVRHQDQDTQIGLLHMVIKWVSPVISVFFLFNIQFV